MYRRLTDVVDGYALAFLVIMVLAILLSYALRFPVLGVSPTPTAQVVITSCPVLTVTPVATLPKRTEIPAATAPALGR